MYTGYADEGEELNYWQMPQNPLVDRFPTTRSLALASLLNSYSLLIPICIGGRPTR